MLFSHLNCTGNHVVDLMSRCMTILNQILERESQGWYVKFKDRLVAELRRKFGSLACGYNDIVHIVPVSSR